MLSGGCFCGAIRYTIEPGEHLVANCHCTMCRRTSGAPFVTWIIIPRDHFRYERGNPQTLASSAEAVREFCSACGTPLTFKTTRREEHIDITTCSLDDPDSLPPTIAAHEESKLSWLHQTEPTS